MYNQIKNVESFSIKKKTHLNLADGSLGAENGLVDRHLNRLLAVSHDDGAEGGVVRVDDALVHGPKPMEVQNLLVPEGE